MAEYLLLNTGSKVEKEVRAGEVQYLTWPDSEVGEAAWRLISGFRDRWLDAQGLFPGPVKRTAVQVEREEAVTDRNYPASRYRVIGVHGVVSVDAKGWRWLDDDEVSRG